jgi:hypothetical protein
MLEKGERRARNGPTNLVCYIARLWLFLKLVILTEVQTLVPLTGVASTNSREIFPLIGGVISTCFEFGRALESRTDVDAFKAEDSVTLVMRRGD